ncbi:hypothetical protein WJX81_004166 [Elliptochloris bilobata]|uniref:O-fucosyltransferase family protein n=1 Tax=Elliptochloris bilobata TaxID=381761 RepID=A0AAW1R142_9CHLO
MTGLSAARAARASALSSLPPDFDCRIYLLYHPELRDLGITTEELAREHYARQGRAEGRLHKRVRVLLRYTAGTGLINQHYSHISAIALAAVLGAELVLPPGVKRDSFAHYFSQFKEQNEVTWTPTPLEALLDVDQVVEAWRLRGLTIHRTPVLLPFPDLTEPASAFPLYVQPGIDPRRIIRMGDVYLQNLGMAELVERVRAAVVARAGELKRREPDTPMDYLVVDMPCTFFMLSTESSLPVVTEVARSLTFAPAVRALADRVIAGISGAGGAAGGAGREYNAAHLRLEKDARDWSAIMGGEAVIWHNYIQAMSQAGFSAGVGVYVASGLLTYGASQEMADIIKTLTAAGLCSEVFYKELYLPASEINALSSEQKALVDFLVLARGRSFVGFGSSTFSFYLREYRALAGLPRSASLLADASLIGTDPIFVSAGTVV